MQEDIVLETNEDSLRTIELFDKLADVSTFQLDAVRMIRLEHLVETLLNS